VVDEIRECVREDDSTTTHRSGRGIRRRGIATSLLTKTRVTHLKYKGWSWLARKNSFLNVAMVAVSGNTRSFGLLAVIVLRLLALDSTVVWAGEHRPAPHHRHTITDFTPVVPVCLGGGVSVSCSTARKRL
jgi:hypothetical protein